MNFSVIFKREWRIKFRSGSFEQDLLFLIRYLSHIIERISSECRIRRYLGNTIDIEKWVVCIFEWYLIALPCRLLLRVWPLLYYFLDYYRKKIFCNLFLPQFNCYVFGSIEILILSILIYGVDIGRDSEWLLRFLALHCFSYNSFEVITLWIKRFVNKK